MSWFQNLFGRPSVGGKRINQAELGSLIWDGEGQWAGNQEINGGPIEFFVDGTEDGINGDVAGYAAEILRNFSTYAQQAADLSASDLSISLTDAKSRFRPSSIIFHCKREWSDFFLYGFCRQGR
jgi:hypothetical protein